MFELYQIRYFLAVVETGNFTKASERSCVTQPTLSAGIKKLQGHLQTKLFNRSSRRVFLTEAGTRFVDRAKSIISECTKATDELKEVEVRKIIRFGILRTIPAKLVSKLLRDFRRENKNVVFELFEGTEQEVANKVEGGNLDLALTILRGEPSQDTHILYEEGYDLIIAHDHHLSDKSNISAHDLAEENMIVRTRCEALSETSRYFTDHNIRPRLNYKTEQDERALEMVGTGMGITVMPSTYKSSNIQRKNLKGFNLKRVIGLKKPFEGFNRGSEEVINLFEIFTMSQDWT